MSTATGEHPHQQVIRVRVPAVGTAGNDSEVVIGAATYTGHISAVKYFPDTTQNGANTDSRTISIQNKTASKVPASLALTSGVNLTADTAKTITLSSTATDYDTTAGDVLTFKSLHVGNGIADPGGLVEVTLERD
jgi:hypothetical protein